jgi:N-acetylglucosaminyl-diphospho-decaprenol L-rhamnosyltransferase
VQPSSVVLIVVTYRSGDVLPGFLRSLPPALGGVDRSEVVVVDNASTDDSAAIARADPIVDRCIVLERNAGYAAGINAALRAFPDRDAYFVLNPDVRLWPGCVTALLGTLQGDRVGIAVPRLVDERGRLLRSLRREPTLLRTAAEAILGGPRAGRWSRLGETVIDAASYREPTTAAWATGGALLISGDCVRATGWWDESFFLYEEEVEFCLRARDRGFLLRYVPDATATRVVGEVRGKPHFRALMRVNRCRHFQRRHGPVSAALHRGIVIFGEFVRALTGRPGAREAVAALIRPLEGTTITPSSVYARSSENANETITRTHTSRS